MKEEMLKYFSYIFDIPVFVWAACYAQRLYEGAYFLNPSKHKAFKVQLPRDMYWK